MHFLVGWSTYFKTNKNRFKAPHPPLPSFYLARLCLSISIKESSNVAFLKSDKRYLKRL